MSTRSSQIPRAIGVICQYEYTDPFTKETVRSSCFLKVHKSDQIAGRFQVRMDEIGRGSAVMLNYITENGRAIF